MNNLTINDYLKILKEKLDDYRYTHSLGVAKSAKELAALYGANPEKAYLAGLLHDITKNDSLEEQLQLFDKFGIILSVADKNSTKLWHAISGSVYCKEILGIDDEEIISAIRYHTTGKTNMTLLEQIVYIADFISEDRTYSDVNVVRNLAKNNLNDACVYTLNYTVNSLNGLNLAVHPDTLNALKFYSSLIKENK